MDAALAARPQAYCRVHLADMLGTAHDTHVRCERIRPWPRKVCTQLVCTQGTNERSTLDPAFVADPSKTIASETNHNLPPPSILEKNVLDLHVQWTHLTITSKCAFKTAPLRVCEKNAVDKASNIGNGLYNEQSRMCE